MEWEIDTLRNDGHCGGEDDWCMSGRDSVSASLRNILGPSNSKALHRPGHHHGYLMVFPPLSQTSRHLLQLRMRRVDLGWNTYLISLPRQGQNEACDLLVRVVLCSEDVWQRGI